MKLSNVVYGVALASAVLLSGTARAQAPLCGNPFEASTGPWDYRTATPAQRAVVENRHFTPEVRMMRKGAGTSRNLAADIAYTLRVFPNHHQALMTMSEWALKIRQDPPPDAVYTVACWFERALRFAPDDALVKVVYGTALIKRGRTQDAIGYLEGALAVAGDDANVYYNLGLAYFDLKDYTKSLANAHAAYRLGFPLPGLKNKLERAGAWQPIPVSAPAAASAAPGGETVPPAETEAAQ